jgi:hypothetical protein
MSIRGGVTWSPVAYAGGTYYEVSRRPLADVKDAARLADYPWPDPDWWDVDALEAQIAAWDADSSCAICLDDFGARLCFHGGACVQQLLPRVDAARVHSEIRHLIDVMGRDDGFILSPTHAVQVDTPPDNILAMYAAAGSLLDHKPRPASAGVTAPARYGTAALVESTAWAGQ